MTIYNTIILRGRNEVIELDARRGERRLNAARGLFTFHPVKPLNFT